MTGTLFLVLDVQEAFRKAIDLPPLISPISKFSKVCKLLGIPVILTEQYPKGLGKTVAELGLSPEKLFEKTEFDCFSNTEFSAWMEKEHPSSTLVIAGLEAHVCVLQAALSAKKRGHEVIVLADGIASQKKGDYDLALRRMEQEGVHLASAEMEIFSLIPSSGHPKFRAVSRIVKGESP